MRPMIIMLALVLGCTCVSQPATNVASVAQPQASYYLTPADCYSTRGNVTSLWPLLVLNPADQFYGFELPIAPWGDGLPQALRVLTPQFDAWLMLSDYENETWEMQSTQNVMQHPWYKIAHNVYGCDLTQRYRSDWDETFVTLWPLDHPGACQVWVDYAAPENYIYATVDPVDCDQIGKGWPFCITFWASNLREVSDFYVWYGIWAEDGGYGGLYAVDHEDYPMGLYDLGVRNQGGEDYDDQNDDSVYAPLGLDLGNTQGALRNVMKIGIDMFRDGHRGEAERYDFLRERREIIEYEAPVYSGGVATWQDGESFFTGQSGALFNTVMSIERPGNYVLYFNVNRPEWPHFVRGDYDVDAVCGPPVMFDVHDTAG